MIKIPATSSKIFQTGDIVLVLPSSTTLSRLGISFLSQDRGKNYQELLCKYIGIDGRAELGCFDHENQPSLVHTMPWGTAMAFAIPGRITRVCVLKSVRRLPSEKYQVKPFTDDDMSNFRGRGLLR